MAKTKDRKITASISSTLMDDVDDYVHTHSTNRSRVIEKGLLMFTTLQTMGDVDEVFEKALRLYQQEQERELYRAYYANLTDEAKAEAAAWRRVGEETAAKQWPKPKK